MKTVSVRTMIGESLAGVGKILFSAPNPTRWARLLLIALLAGSLGMMVPGFRLLRYLAQRPVEPRIELVSRGQNDRSPQAGSSLSQAEKTSRSRYQFVDGIFRPDPSQYPKISKLWLWIVLIPLILLFFLMGAVLWFFGVWVSTRFKCMWLRAVRDGEVELRSLYKQCQRESDDLFDFWLGLSSAEALSYLAATLWLVIAIYAAGGGVQNRLDWTPETASAIVGPPLGAFLLVWFVFLVARTVGNDFIVPLAVRYPEPSRKLWARWVVIYSGQRARIWKYLILRLFLALLWVAVQVTALLLLQRALTLPALLTVIVGGFVFLPAAIFFRKFSLLFLDRLDEGVIV